MFCNMHTHTHTHSVTHTHTLTQAKISALSLVVRTHREKILGKRGNQDNKIHHYPISVFLWLQLNTVNQPNYILSCVQFVQILYDAFYVCFVTQFIVTNIDNLIYSLYLSPYWRTIVLLRSNFFEQFGATQRRFYCTFYLKYPPLLCHYKITVVSYQCYQQSLRHLRDIP